MAKVTSGQSLRHSLLCPRFGLAHAYGHALEVGVGEVVQGDRLAEAEDRLRLREQVSCKASRCLYSASEARYRRFQIHRLEVEADQLTERRALLQPRVCREFTTRMGHAARTMLPTAAAICGRFSRARRAGLEAALAHHRQRRMLDADAAWAHQIERVEVDLLESARLAWVRHRCFGARDARGRRSQRNQLRRIAMRQGFRPLSDSVASSKGFCPCSSSSMCMASAGHSSLGKSKWLPQVEQRGLLDRATDPRGLHQTVGRVGLAGRASAGLAAPNEHPSMLHENRPPAGHHLQNIMALHFTFGATPSIHAG